VILDTNADLNIYKEMWKMEEANTPGPTGPCCGTMNNSTGKEIKNLAEIDFNIWTGKLIYTGIQFRRTTNDSHI
jgi:arsenite methyltransferase